MKPSRLFASSLIATTLTAPYVLAGDTLVQVSTIDALVKGIYDGEATFAELKKSGDFGIGTMDNLDGEMLALGGMFYQVTSDGKVHEIPDDAETPFAAVTFFEKEKTFATGAHESLQVLQDWLDSEIGSANLFHAIQITGTFPTMHLRSVPKQEPPFSPLTEVVKEQALFRLGNIAELLSDSAALPL